MGLTHEDVDRLDENVRSGEDLDSLDVLTAALHTFIDNN